MMVNELVPRGKEGVGNWLTTDVQRKEREDSSLLLSGGERKKGKGLLKNKKQKTTCTCKSRLGDTF